MQIALFRYGIISDFVNRKGVLKNGEKEKLLNSKVNCVWNIPFSERTHISRATILNWIKRFEQGKRKIVPLDTVEVADPVNVEETVEKQWQADRVAQAIAQLPAAQRDVIALRFFSGLSSKEVGGILGKSSGAVREMQSAGVKSLRRLMGDTG